MAIETLLLTLALAAQAPQASAPSRDALASAYYLFLQAQTAEENGDVDAALEQYRRALELVPQAATIRAELAAIYAQRGDVAGARAEAGRALESEPENRSAHRLLGLLDASTLGPSPAPQPGDPVVQSAIDHLERATANGARDPAVSLALGDLYVRATRYDRAIVILEQFLIDRPGYPQAVMLLVQAYRGAGQGEAAERLIRSLRGADPQAAVNRLRAIEGLEAKNEWARAAEAWASLIEEQPGQTAYRLRYATALVNGGDIERGRSELEALARDDPDDVRVWYLVAQVEQRAGRTEAAESAARRIGTIDPDDGRGPLALAMVLAARDDHRGVVAALEARVAAPTEADLGTGLFTQMASMLSDAWVELGQARQGIRTLEAARKHAPTDRTLLFNLGATYERDDQAGRAEEVFREIIDADPDHAPTLNYLGYMLAERGRKLPEALTFIERAIAVAGENPAYLDSLGWTYYRMSRFADAIAPLERAAKGAPDVSVIQDHLGDAYAKVGRHREAGEAFDRALAGDLDGVDERSLTRKRDRAREADRAR